MTTRLYFVVRYGNELGGPDGRDTVFLVAAQDHETAAKLVDDQLREFRDSNRRVGDYCNVIGEIWETASSELDTLTGLENGILAGPLYGLGAARLMRRWERRARNEEWQEDEQPVDDKDSDVPLTDWTAAERDQLLQ